jgi:hypothetical protein
LAVNQQQLWGPGGEGRGNPFAATLLAEHLILIDHARRRTILMDKFRDGGSVLVLLFFWEGVGERDSNELRIDLFLLNTGHNS